MTESVYSTSSDRYDCTCAPGQDVKRDGHGDDCPESFGWVGQENVADQADSWPQ